MGGQAERAQPVLRCNGCWADVDCKEHSVVASCGHMYCLTCCQTIMDSDDSTCPICTQVRQWVLGGKPAHAPQRSQLAAVFMT